MYRRHISTPVGGSSRQTFSGLQSSNSASSSATSTSSRSLIQSVVLEDQASHTEIDNINEEGIDLYAEHITDSVPSTVQVAEGAVEIDAIGASNVNPAEIIARPIGQDDYDFGLPPRHEVQYLMQSLTTGTEKDKKLLAQMIWNFVCMKSFDSMSTGTGPQRIGGQWRTMHDIFFEHVENLNLKSFYAEQFFAYMPQQVDHRGWMKEFLDHVQIELAKTPTVEALKNAEMRSLNGNPEGIQAANFGRLVLEDSKVTRSFINNVGNVLLKETEGIVSKSGIANESARYKAIRDKLYIIDGEEKCQGATRAHFEREKKNGNYNGRISNQSDEFKGVFNDKFMAYISNKPIEYWNKNYLAWLLCGRPAGNSGLASCSSGRAQLQMELPTLDNPTGVYKVDGLAQLKASGALSRQGRRNASRLQDLIVHARKQAVLQEQDPEAAEAKVREDNPLSVVGGGKRGKAVPVVPPPHPTDVRVIELKLKKPSPAKLDVKEALKDTLKRKYTQIFHANKKIQELEDQGKTRMDCDELEDAYLERADSEKIVKKCNKKLDDLTNSELFAEDNSD